MSDELVRILPFSVDLGNTVEKTELHDLFVMGDSLAHRIELEITRGGEAVSLSGCTVNGYFTSFAEDTTIMVDGEVKNGKASVTLSKPCYTLHGQFVLTIQITGGGVDASVFVGDGFMRQTKTETIIFDDYVIYDVSTLLSQIGAMKAATEAANTATANANTATGKANTAAGAANQAAGAANQAADAANAAAKNWGDSTAANSAKLGGMEPRYYLYRRNLLDNSDFTNPVNQRVAVSSSGNKYGIDRWLGTYTVSDGYIDNTGGMTQYIPEEKIVSGRKYTASVGLSDGTVYFKSGSLSKDVTNWQINAWFGSLFVGVQYISDKHAYLFRLNTKNEAVYNIQWVAFYEGEYTAETLPEYQPKGYAAELAECQRYFNRMTFKAPPINSTASAVSQNIGFFFFQVPMRIVPTAIFVQKELPTIELGFFSQFGFEIGGGDSYSRLVTIDFSADL